MALAHVTLATRDLARSTTFFHEVMGWTPIGRPRNNAKPAAWLEIAPGQELHLVEVPEFQPSPFEEEYGRHVALTLPRGRLPAAQGAFDRPRRQGDRSPPQYSVRPLLLSRSQRLRFRGPRTGAGPRTAIKVIAARPGACYCFISPGRFPTSRQHG